VSGKENTAIVAERYAGATFEVAAKQNAEADTLNAMKSFIEIMDKSTAMHGVVNNPAVSKKVQQQAVNAILNKIGAGKTACSFFETLVKNRRLQLLPEIYQQFKVYIDKKNGEIEAEVHSVNALKAPHLKQIEDALKHSLNSRVRVKNLIRPEILGGLRVRIGTKLFDASLSAKLDKLEQTLKDNLKNKRFA